MWDTGNFNKLAAYVTMVIVVLAALIACFTWLSKLAGTQFTERK
jgi:hypothetical protein